MTKVPCIPQSAPFTLEQRAWLNGFLAGLFSETELNDVSDRSDATARSGKVASTLLILYGSQTGTAERLARRAAREAAQGGFEARVMEMNAFAVADLAQEQRLLIVTSTWGDGDPPDNAAAFWTQLSSDQTPRLEHLDFAVLALGDRNYSDFCGAGRKLDQRLEELGARRIQSRVDCDVDYESGSNAWLEELWPRWSQSRTAGATLPPSPTRTRAGERADSREVQDVATTLPMPGRQPRESIGIEAPGKSGGPAYGRSSPFPARLFANRCLNAPGSSKETRHFEISLAGSGLQYEVGDALGVVPGNCPYLVAEILDHLGCDGEESVPDRDGVETSLRRALLDHYQITQPARGFVEAMAARTGDARLRHLIEPARQAELDQFLYGREIIDLLLQFPEVRFDPAEFVGLLRKLQPRLYSISSSPRVHANEVHLTVAVVRYQSHGRARKGVCSTFLAERVGDSVPVPVFVHPSRGFRLPREMDRPVIMIGPGTGVAPFRAFLEERGALGATGPNWIFFGDQHEASDFLYRDEIEAMRNDGILTRFDTAFSRDQPEKIYVQHRMREQAKELWRWLEAGAHLYVCGDAKRMARDVDAALHDVIQKAGGKTPEQAANYVASLKTQKRYQRDVY